VAKYHVNIAFYKGIDTNYSRASNL